MNNNFIWGTGDDLDFYSGKIVRTPAEIRVEARKLNLRGLYETDDDETLMVYCELMLTSCDPDPFLNWLIGG